MPAECPCPHHPTDCYGHNRTPQTCGCNPERPSLARRTPEEPKIDYFLGTKLMMWCRENGPAEYPAAGGVLRIEFVPFSPLPNPRNYTPLSVNCNISSASLADVVRILGPAFVYDLYVNPYLTIDTRSTLRRIQGVIAEENPLAPHINLHPDDSLSKYEWYLAANGKGAGSKGV